MNARLVTILIMLLVFDNFLKSNAQVIDKTCKNTLECETLCCINSKCEKNDICQNYKIITYAVIGGIGVLFILLTIWYLYSTIKEARTNVENYKKKLLEQDKKRTILPQNN